jgi:hypothetical protein
MLAASGLILSRVYSRRDNKLLRSSLCEQLLEGSSADLKS